MEPPKVLKNKRHRQSRNKRRTLSGLDPAENALVAKGERCWRLRDCATARIARWTFGGSIALLFCFFVVRKLSCSIDKRIFLKYY